MPPEAGGPPQAQSDRAGGLPEPSSELPAPYQDPFAALGHDLQAVLATLRLRVQELWRRNRQGDLSVPGFWPQDLAPLFWPLLLALGLAALVALPIGLGRMLPERSESAPEQPQKLLTTPLPQARPTAEPEPIPAAEAPAELAAEPLAKPVPLPEPELQPEPEPAPLELDPLLALLHNDDPRHLIVSAHPEPAAGLLQLQIGEAFGLLPPADQRAEAERWLERCQNLGYGRLELVDGSGRLLGRQALVGSGMILLEPNPPR